MFNTPISNIDNTVSTVQTLMRKLKVKVTATTIRNELLLHPDFPSLYSINKVLNKFKIDNAAIQLDTIDQIREIGIPFICHLNVQGGWYVLITSITDKYVNYIDSQKGNVRETISNFREKWTGTILLAEINEISGEKNYKQKHINEIKQSIELPFVITGTALLFLVFIINRINSLDYVYWILLITKTVGLAISVLLTIKTISNDNSLANNLCKNSVKTDCNTVLNSSGAKLGGWINWSDIGAAYFTGGLLSVLSSNIFPNIGPSLFYLSLFSIPFVFYSIYYQYKVANKWCTLCLYIQAILVIEFMIALSERPVIISSFSNIILVFLFLTSIILWILFKSLISQKLDSKRESIDLVKVKRDPDLFRLLLLKQTKMNIPLDSNTMFTITLGNHNAENTITMITNPYCEPCEKAFANLTDLLNSSDEFKANIIFLCDGKDGVITKTATLLMALSNTIENPLKEWYNQNIKSYEKWSSNYPIEINKEYWSSVTKQHEKWCTLNKIFKTPTIFINDYEIPKIYEISDLEHIEITQELI